MFLRRIIPVLQLTGNGLYKTKCFKNKVYIGDPINVVQILNKKSVNELILLNISPERFSNNVDYSFLKENINFLIDAVKNFGSSTIVSSIDYKFIDGKRVVYTNSGQKRINLQFEEVVKMISNSDVGEIILTNIDLDGTFFGYDLAVIDSVKFFLKTPLIINGGAKNLNNMADALKRGAQAVAAGSLFSLRMPYRAVLLSYPDDVLIKKVFEDDDSCLQ